MCELDLEGLGLQVFFEAVLAEFAAVAGLLVAAEGREQVVLAAVDVDLAGADAFGDALSAFDVAGPDAAGRWRLRVLLRGWPAAWPTGT